VVVGASVEVVAFDVGVTDVVGSTVVVDAAVEQPARATRKAQATKDFTIDWRLLPAIEPRQSQIHRAHISVSGTDIGHA
jgi:hypothetical protein